MIGATTLKALMIGEIEVRRSSNNIYDDSGVITHKKCIRCLEVKQVECFNMLYSKRQPKGYRNAECHDCKKERDRNYVRKVCKTDEYKAKLKEYRSRDYVVALKEQKQAEYKVSLHGQSCPIYIKQCKETGKLFVGKRKNSEYSKEGELIIKRANSYKYKGDKGRIRKCAICGNEFDRALRTTLYTHVCSDKCSDEYSIEYFYNVKGRDRYFKCIVCGNTFDRSTVPYHNTCSEHCNDMYYSGIRVGHKGRAMFYGGIAEHVDRIKVFERDKWTCKMCGCKTSKKLIGSGLMQAPSLDHITPLSKGGAHTYSNVQCLCRRCNSIKNASQIGQQVLSI